MAELIGIVGSAISVAQLASQIASSVMKLKSYLDQIKDAPVEIRTLAEQIEGVQILLGEMECDQTGPQALFSGTNPVLRSLAPFKRALERLGRVVDELAAEFENAKPMKRRWTAVKTILKRERIEGYKSNLATASMQLLLAYQLHISSLIQMQPDIILNRLIQYTQLEGSQQLVADLPPCSNNRNPESFSSEVQSARKCRSWNTQYHWVEWRTYRSSLFKRAWNLFICRTQQGWQFSFSSYAFVPEDSLVVQYTKAGNIKGLQQLFSSGQASPFTIFSGGIRRPHFHDTLLGIGFTSAHYELCSFLINEGADPDFHVRHRFPPTLEFATNSILSRPDPENNTKLAHLLASKTEITIGTLCRYRGPVAGFSTLLRYLDTARSLMPLERCQIATELAFAPVINGPDVFLAALGCDPKSLSRLVYESYYGKRSTLLHAVVQAVGNLMEHMYDSQVRPIVYQLYLLEEAPKYLSGWTTILHDLLATGADFQAISEPRSRIRRIELTHPRRPMTPLLLMFRSCHQSTWRHPYRRATSGALDWWIERLYEAGVDLIGYGLKEKDIWGQVDVAQECVCRSHNDWSVDHGDQPWFWKRLIGFNYGPSPTDWIFWENEPTDEFAGDFWLMLERKEEVMPGTWIE